MTKNKILEITGRRAKKVHVIIGLMLLTMLLDNYFDITKESGMLYFAIIIQISMLLVVNFVINVLIDIFEYKENETD